MTMVEELRVLLNSALEEMLTVEDILELRSECGG
jgi:hypothetical protein